jgi:predicted permease
MSVAAGLLFGLLPAARLSNPDLNAAIRENRRTQRPIGGLMRAGAPLVAAEVALAMILLTGTGLMVNSLVRMRSVDLGFEPARAVAVNVSLPRSQYSTALARNEYFERFLDNVRQLPGVQFAGAIEYLQVGNAAPPAGLRAAGPPGTGIWRVTPGYFEAMGMPLLHGRDFGAEDVRSNSAVAILSESVARHVWPGGPAVGRQLRLDDKSEVTIVGVVKDVRSGYGRPIRPSVYRPITRQQAGQTIAARTSGDPAVLAIAMRTEAQRLEPRAVVAPPGSVATMLDRGIAGFRFETSLFILFGVLGLIVAAIGVYGLMAFWVGARTREMGVRIALGANTRQMKSLVARQSATPLVAGLVCGMIGAFVLARRLESLLYGITPHDVPTLAGVAAVLLAVGMAAAYLPARRAARVDPMIVLRSE